MQLLCRAEEAWRGQRGARREGEAVVTQTRLRPASIMREKVEARTHRGGGTNRCEKRLNR